MKYTSLHRAQQEAFATIMSKMRSRLRSRNDDFNLWDTAIIASWDLHPGLSRKRALKQLSILRRS